MLLVAGWLEASKRAEAVALVQEHLHAQEPALAAGSPSNVPRGCPACLQ